MQIKQALLLSLRWLGAFHPRAANRRAVTKEGGATALGALLLAFGAGCVPSSLPALPPIQSTPETDKTEVAVSPGPEAAAIVSGTPTEVYALVARGVLGCWFGSGGPFKGSHVFQAEADPPAKGGGAEIVIHERDSSLHDQRGSRAYRISFASEATGVRVGMSALRFEATLAQVMAKDVEGWAKGDAGCRLRAFLPPPTPPPAKAGKGPKKKR